MGAGHDHGASSLGERHRGRLWIALILTTGFMLVEVAGGWYANSLALFSDAGHMATDALGIAMALAAIIAVRRAGARPRQTFGLYRLEVLAALANTVLLFGVAIWVLVESISRFDEPPEVKSTPMLIIAVIGLLTNVVSLMILRSGAKESLNVRGAYFEVLGDMLGSLAVIVAAILIATTGWWYADPILATAVGLFILPRAARLGRDALRILLQSAPAGIDIPDVDATLREIPGVVDVHDLHIWTLTSGMDVVSAHLSIDSDGRLASVLTDARTKLHDQYGIDHATLQVEPTAANTCHTPSW
ncbi:cation diffusion facilitator family transporter [Stackebrandtia soli]|uniref:cation diffusion facilitator family transporter n=1 Tax=Stackebrandtia soli TaxID=1892856 RepID=UPI0039E83362